MEIFTALLGVVVGFLLSELNEWIKEKGNNKRLLAILKSEINHNLLLLKELIDELDKIQKHYEEIAVDISDKREDEQKLILLRHQINMADRLLLIPWPQWNSYIWENNTAVFSDNLKAEKIQEIFFFYEQFHKLSNIRIRMETEQNIIDAARIGKGSPDSGTMSRAYFFTSGASFVEDSHREKPAQLWIRFCELSKDILANGNPLEKK